MGHSDWDAFIQKGPVRIKLHTLFALQDLERVTSGNFVQFMTSFADGHADAVARDAILNGTKGKGMGKGKF